MTGIRAYAALWIYFGHLLLYPVYDGGFASAQDAGWLIYFISFHFLGVDFFFVLSGFVLSLKYRDYFEAPRKSAEIDRFFALRLARVYPLHLFFTALMGAMLLADIPAPISSGAEAIVYDHWKLTGLLNLLLMNGWGIHPVASWNEPAWTLSIFFMLYILFPNLITAARYFPKSGAANMLLMFGLLIAYGILRETLGLTSHSDGTGAILRGLFFFTTGLMVARLYALGYLRNLPWGKIGLGLLLIGVGLMYVWALFGQFPVTLFHLLYPLALMALLYANASSLRLFTHPVLQWLGKRSFAIYLVHYPYLLLVKHYGGEWIAAEDSVQRILIYCVTTALMLLISDMCYRLIEMPCYAYAKKRLTLRA